MKEIRRFWRMLPNVIVVFILAACDSSDNQSENLIRMPDGSVTVSDGSDISTIAYFDVNSNYLRLVTSNGVSFSFRESTLK